MKTEKVFKDFYRDYYVDDVFDWTPQPKTNTYSHPQLTMEQQSMVNEALKGSNILVDACVGSGKTTSIQALCDAIPANKKILYLTYSKLLKLDARAKIKRRNITVTNYHGFAYMILKQNHVNAAQSDLVRKCLMGDYPMPYYDVLVLDEYQDLELDTSKLVTRIKDANPHIQIIAVGDMKQKVQDKTTLKVMDFMQNFLGDYKKLDFTYCFRLCQPHADKLSYIWDKHINGVNTNCKIAVLSKWDAIEFLGLQNPSDVLCLGQRTGDLADALNELEDTYPDKYNKHTIYASINDHGEGSTEPTPTSGIFTTYDASKGLERKICVLFDFTPSYWNARVKQPDANPEILRNIFMVAASRGKELIIFVENSESIMDDHYIRDNMVGGKPYDTFNISSMFDFKFEEEKQKCLEYLEVTQYTNMDPTVINIQNHDAMIDLAPCIGIYQEASFFNGYSIEKEFDLIKETRPDSKIYFDPDETLEKQILRLVSVETMQHRYLKQVQTPYITDEQASQIKNRLKTFLSTDEDCQVPCRIDIKSDSEQFALVGYADVVRPGRVIELKFNTETSKTAFLQVACYMIAMHIENGTVWNVKNNELYTIKIKDPAGFLAQVVKTVTKGSVLHFTSSFSNDIHNKEKPERKAKKTRILNDVSKIKKRPRARLKAKIRA